MCIYSILKFHFLVLYIRSILTHVHRGMYKDVIYILICHCKLLKYFSER